MVSLLRNQQIVKQARSDCDVKRTILAVICSKRQIYAEVEMNA